MKTLSVSDLANVTGGANQGIRPPFIGGFEGSDTDVWNRMGKGSAPRGGQGIRPPFIGGWKGSDNDVWSRRCRCR